MLSFSPSSLFHIVALQNSSLASFSFSIFDLSFACSVSFLSFVSFFSPLILRLFSICCQSPVKVLFARLSPPLSLLSSLLSLLIESLLLLNVLEVQTKRDDVVETNQQQRNKRKRKAAASLGKIPEQDQRRKPYCSWNWEWRSHHVVGSFEWV